MNGFVRVVEVGPRDGLQNESAILSTDRKLRYIAELIDAGCRELEVASFVRPEIVPQLADSAEIVRRLSPPLDKVSGDSPIYSPIVGAEGMVFWSLVPNQRGLERALEAGARSIAVFAAASDSFSKRNIGMGIIDSLAEYEKVVATAKAEGCAVRGYISTVTHCPYEGRVSPVNVSLVADSLQRMGCDEIALGETMGKAHHDEIAQLLDEVLTIVPADRLAGHFHDTGGRALENVGRALEYGLRCFDGSAGGLGGCPFATGSPGNVATEALVRFLHGKGYITGLSAEKIALAGFKLSAVLPLIR